MNTAAFKAEKFTNPKNGRHYELVRADQVPPTETNLASILAASNEPAIYEFLWRDILKGQPYPPEKAVAFLTWAKKSWDASSNFVFVVKDDSGNVVGAADIKGNDPQGAEIGYWASAAHSGIATPAVRLMCRQAALAGFTALFAFVKTSNPRSASVLERNGFVKFAQEDHTKPYPRFHFRRALTITI